jgi:hypothetical protein
MAGGPPSPVLEAAQAAAAAAATVAAGAGGGGGGPQIMSFWPGVGGPPRPSPHPPPLGPLPD